MALDRLEVIQKLQIGLKPAEVAKLMGCAESTVVDIERDATGRGILRVQITRKSRTERAAHRKQIAQWIAEGHTAHEAAEKFKTSETQIYGICREHNVEPMVDPAGRAKKASQLVVIAMLIDGLGQAEVADALGVSRQYVNICAKAGRVGGIFDAVERSNERAKKAGSKLRREVIVERSIAEDGLNNSFRQNLRTACESIGLSRRRLADASDVHFTYINDILQGRSVPTLKIVERLVSGLRKEGLREVKQDHLFLAPKDFSAWLDERQNG